MTKRMLAMEWAMSVEEAIEAEAIAQALCMTTEDFARAYRAFAAKETPVFQGRLSHDARHPSCAWPFFEERHRRFRGRSERLGRAEVRRSRRPPRRRRFLPSARVARSATAGWLRAVVPAGLWRAVPGLRRAHPVPGPRDPGLSRTASPISPSRCRGSAPARSRSSARTTLKARYLPPVATRRGDRRLRALGAGGRLGRGRAWRRPRRADGDGHVRLDGDEDLDLERRHRRPLRGVRAHRRGARRQGLSAFVVDADTPGLSDRRAHRRDRAASARDAALRATAAFRWRSASAGRARASRSRWRPSTCSARRSAPRRSASRAARSTRRSDARRVAPACSARRWAICS